MTPAPTGRGGLQAARRDEVAPHKSICNQIPPDIEASNALTASPPVCLGNANLLNLLIGRFDKETPIS